MSIIDDVLAHVGVGAKDNPPGRGSGRYPLGSGKKPFQHANAFMTRVQQLREQGMKEKDIAKAMGFETTTQLRVQYNLARTEVRTKEADRARKLRDEGYSLNQITKMMGYNNDSSIRSLLNMDSYSRMKQAETTAEYLKKIVDEKGMIDVGTGVERLPELGNISREKLNEALYLLELDGYPTYGGGVPQATNPGKQTNLKVLCPPGTEHKEIFEYGNIHSIADYDQILTDGGDNIRNAFEFPASLDSSRLAIRYAEDGGTNKDGVIELRRGVKDLSLGDSHYAQVRILVDGDRYLKGMAVYSDNLPDGVDVLFNTNKSSDVPKMEALKKVKETPDGEIDRDNPFGALLKQKGGQSYYDDPDGIFTDKETGKKQSLSLINKTREEGDWNEWDDNIASQFLAKQPQYLIDRQLKISKEAKQAEFDKIMDLENPTIKRQLLQDFADDCDSAAVHLKAAALPRQRWQVILPIEDIKDNEIFAPNFNDGEQVALIRYPHGGRFEIPILTVNNKNKEGREYFGKNALDAVGINKKNADILSGADFDGDTVLVIPTGGSTIIKNSDPLPGLKDFDPKFQYGYSEKKVNSKGETEYYRDGKKFKEMKNTQNEMGKISNLIMDMTLQKATNEELARAVRHSMVVIDAGKHKLDYKASEADNNIKELRKKYQPEGGASTLLTRAKSQETVSKRKGNAKLNDDGTVRWDVLDDEKRFYAEKKKVRKKDENGKYIKDSKGNYVFETDENGKYVWEDTGKVKERTQRSTKMEEAFLKGGDAYDLVSLMDTPQERAYADYANYMKRLAADARKVLVNPPKLEYDKEAAKTYAKEVESLNSKLNTALLNRPKERIAQTRANAVVKRKEEAAKAVGEPLSKEQIRKEKQRALNQARLEVGAEREPVYVDDKEWEAIQAGAIHDSKLMTILKNSDKDRLRELATPRESFTLSEAQQSRIKSLEAAGYTNAEIAKAVGVSTSTVIKYL